MSNDAFLILFLILITLMTVIPLFMRRFKVPQVIALLIAGMLIGPNGLDLLGKLAPMLSFLGQNPGTIESHSVTLINSLGSLGLLFLMTLAGMEADFKLIRSSKRPVIALSILTFLLPAISGYLIYSCFKAEDFPGKLLYASLFASHSVGIVFPIIRELKITKTLFGSAVLISTVITDIASIVLLAVSVQMKKVGMVQQVEMHKTLSLFDYIDPATFGNYFILFFLLVVMVYFALVLILIPRAGDFIIRIMNKGEDMVITCFIFVILIAVLVGEFLGINLVVGAFLAGLGLSRIMNSEDQTAADAFHKFEGIGYGFLIPFLFISIGMKTDLRMLFDSIGNIQIILLTVLGLVGSKVFSGWLALRLCGFENAKGICAGVMTVPQLSATLAAAAIGKELGMLDNNFFNAIVVLSIVTTLPVPNIVRWIIEHYGLKFRKCPPDEKPAVEMPENMQDHLL